MAYIAEPKALLGLSICKLLTGFMFIVFLTLQLPSNSPLAQSIEDHIDHSNQSQTETTIRAENETNINSSTPVTTNQVSSSSVSTSPAVPTPQITTSTTLPPSLPTPLPSKGYPKMYSGSPQSLIKDNHFGLKGKSSSLQSFGYLGRTKRMKRSKPNMIRTESSGNPFSLIKLLLSSQLNPQNEYPMDISMANLKPAAIGQFGSVYSSNNVNLDDGAPNIHSKYNPEKVASFYPLTLNDLAEAIELSEGDGAGYEGDGWNQGATDLINSMDTGDSNNHIDMYPMDPFIPLRSFRASPRSSMRSPMRPVVSMKRKKQYDGLYLLPDGIERTPNSISLFTGNNHPNNQQYEPAISRFDHGIYV